jgi:hypothetical protein
MRFTADQPYADPEGAAVMTDRDLVILARIVSACTLGLWAFAAGLLIGVFLFQ